MINFFPKENQSFETETETETNKREIDIKETETDEREWDKFSTLMLRFGMNPTSSESHSKPLFSHYK